MPKLTIGVPVFNGEIYLDRALTSLRQQTFTDWQMVVADNASTDDTAAIARRHATEDGRIRFVQRPENIGAARNFIRLTENVETPYFMWAAADDEWTDDYVAKSIAALEATDAGLASGEFVNVDHARRPLRTMSFSQLSSSRALVRLARFAAMREASGKANVFYSVFRTGLLKEVCATGQQTMGEWGGDYGIVSAALSRARHVSTDARLYKRVTTESDILTASILARGDYASQQFGGSFPPAILPQFIETMTRGVAGKAARNVVAGVLRLRRVETLRWEMGQKIRNLRRRLGRPLERRSL